LFVIGISALYCRGSIRKQPELPSSVVQSQSLDSADRIDELAKKIVKTLIWRGLSKGTGGKVRDS
jgi:hypothetical protein